MLDNAPHESGLQRERRLGVLRSSSSKGIHAGAKRCAQRKVEEQPLAHARMFEDTCARPRP
jgi:hypothetical protein